MASFAYQARTTRGERVTGTLEAPTELAVDDALRERGLCATLIRAEKKPPPAAAAPLRSAKRVRLKQRELALFSMHLSTVLRAGLPLSLGLRNSIEGGSNKRVQTVAAALLDHVEAGKLLSEGMEELPAAFPQYYVNLVKAGETVGHVDEVLHDLVASLDWQMNLKSDIRQAAVYPAMLLTMLFCLALGIAIFVMPRLVNSLMRTGMTLPQSARIVVGFGEFVQAYWLQVVVGIAWVIAGVRIAVATPRGHDVMDAVKLRLPLFGPMIRQVALSQFAHHLRMMVKAGVNFVIALNVVEHVVGNHVLARAIASARDRVIGGSTLAEALRETGQFTPLVIQMVATGEITGSLEETLKKVSEYYDREVPATIKRISTAVEPIVYVILGVVVLGVAFTLYSPLMSMLSQIQTRPRF